MRNTWDFPLLPSFEMKKTVPIQFALPLLSHTPMERTASMKNFWINAITRSNQLILLGTRTDGSLMPGTNVQPSGHHAMPLAALPCCSAIGIPASEPLQHQSIMLSLSSECLRWFLRTSSLLLFA